MELNEKDNEAEHASRDAVPAFMEIQKAIRPSESRPVYKMTVRLIHTLKYINKVYYDEKANRLRENKQKNRGGVHNDGFDDQNYDYILSPEDVFNNRYVLKAKIGQGSFGQVVSAHDRTSESDVAIKIIKSRRPFMSQAQTEIELLRKMQEEDVDDERNCVRMIDSFVHQNHQCIVFDMLSYNLYELLRNTRFKGLSLTLIRKFSKQLLRALDFLASPRVDIIHCDLKPENILLRHPRRSAIRVIDFGSSCLSSRRTYTYIQSRFYRSPEVLLGLKYSQKIDIWSLGCVLVELHTGEPLFGGHDQVDQMSRIVDVLGMPPFYMIDASQPQVRSLFFDRVDLREDNEARKAFFSVHESQRVMSSNGDCGYVLKRPKNRPLPVERSTLQTILGVTSGGPGGRRMGEEGHSETDYREFHSFVENFLVFDPGMRWGAAHGLSHHFLNHPDTYTILPPLSNNGPLVPEYPDPLNPVCMEDASNALNGTNSNSLDMPSSTSGGREKLDGDRNDVVFSASGKEIGRNSATINGNVGINAALTRPPSEDIHAHREVQNASATSISMSALSAMSISSSTPASSVPIGVPSGTLTRSFSRPSPPVYGQLGPNEVSESNGDGVSLKRRGEYQENGARVRSRNSATLSKSTTLQDQDRKDG